MGNNSWGQFKVKEQRMRLVCDEITFVVEIPTDLGISKTRDRPLIFIGHSFGGLLIQQVNSISL